MDDETGDFTDIEDFFRLAAGVARQLEVANARLIWWPREVPVPYFCGPIGQRKMSFPET